jgi:ribulose-5-phosphate 4-epimerase/fuculose-1-phosphate aldolase
MGRGGRANVSSMPKRRAAAGRALKNADFRLWSLAYRILDMEGHTDMTQGHLSIRDPDGRGFWMKRTGIGFAEVKAQKDFVLVDLEGRRLAGAGVHGEWPIHAEIFRSRPDINAIGHTHPFYACVFSACREPLRAVAHEGSNLNGAVTRYDGTSNLIDTPQLGRDVAEALGSAPAVLMRNHGITFCGPNVEECVLAGIFLERACHAQLVVGASGFKWTHPDDREMLEKYQTVMAPSFIRNSWEFYVRKLSRRERGIAV